MSPSISKFVQPRTSDRREAICTSPGHVSARGFRGVRPKSVRPARRRGVPRPLPLADGISRRGSDGRSRSPSTGSTPAPRTRGAGVFRCPASSRGSAAH